ncbi:unnamed protein product [Arctogadus glacialis]
MEDRDHDTCSAGQDLTDDQLLKVAETLGKEWKQAAILLGLKKEDLDVIKAKHRPVIHNRQKMLMFWKHQRPPGEATAQDMLRGLEKLKDLPVETRRLLEGHISDKTVVKPRKQNKGHIADKTVVKPRKQNKGELQRIHSEFVKTVKISVTRCLLDDLWQLKVFSTEDKDSVMEKGKIKTDMARCLIDMVIGKGEKASRIMIESMKKRDPDLCSTLGLISSPAGVGHIADKTVVKPRKQNKGELQRIHSEFVKTVKISVTRCLLDDLWQLKVFSTEDKDSVMEKGKIKTDMARCLIDMVIGKGEKASRIMIESMKKRDPDLCSTLGLISSPAGVGNGGRKRNGSKSEEVANKKPCTVDGSDSITETRSTGQTLTEKELMNVAKTLGNDWEQIAIHLEITTKDLDDIKAEHRSVAMQKLKMLVMWKCRRPPGKATVQDLLECLKDLEDLPVETRLSLTDHRGGPQDPRVSQPQTRPSDLHARSFFKCLLPFLLTSSTPLYSQHSMQFLIPRA